MKPAWKLQTTYIYVFKVGRGLSVFIRTGMNYGLIIDLGDSDDFSPIDFLKKNIVSYLTKYKVEEKSFEIAQAVITHPHTDHISEIEKLDKKEFSLHLLTCPHDKPEAPEEKVDFSRIQSWPGKEGLVEIYKKQYEGRRLPLQTIRFDRNNYVPNIEYGIYYMRPPKVSDLLSEKDDLRYGNGISIVFYLRHGNHSVLIPGDVIPEVFQAIIEAGKAGIEKRYTVFNPSIQDQHPTWHEKTTDQPTLKELFKKHGLSIYVAPHHGLESCYFSEFNNYLKNGKPELVVVSEKQHRHDNDGTVHQNYKGKEASIGLPVTIAGKTEDRNSINTAEGYHYLIAFDGSGPVRVYGEKNPEDLLSKS